MIAHFSHTIHIRPFYRRFQFVCSDFWVKYTLELWSTEMLWAYAWWALQRDKLDTWPWRWFRELSSLTLILLHMGMMMIRLHNLILSFITCCGGFFSKRERNFENFFTNNSKVNFYIFRENSQEETWLWTFFSRLNNSPSSVVNPQEHLLLSRACNFLVRYRHSLFNLLKQVGSTYPQIFQFLLLHIYADVLC